ncbi:MAG: hypothetical protein WBA68_11255 [Alteraurantiacibacter sp.]
MFQSGFFSSKVGHAALVSIAAMLAFVVFTQLQHDAVEARAALSVTPMVELA